MIKPKIYLVGHSHIDAVWLWDRAETKEVLKYTFERILKLMEDNKEITFVQTTAHFYRWLEIEEPELFNQIKEKIKEGRWEIVGGMWVESDCNVPSGESLVRQILYGKRYFKNKFDIDVRVGWLPDVFGFNWALPQIFKKSGIEYFFTSKLNWQTTIPFPYYAFNWQSPDGSKIIGYQTPGGYNNIDIYSVYKQFKKFQYDTGIKQVILPYGEGDHGGGLDQHMIDEALNADYQDVDITFGKAVDYFDWLKENHEQELPVVNDELYLKTHRGTLSTHGQVKKKNRESEIALNVCEKFAYIARDLLKTSYPQEIINSSWKQMLFNQFHDSLPGTSIKKVYQDLEEDFQEIFKNVNFIISNSLQSLCADIDTSGEGIPVIVFNPLAWERNEIVKIPLTSEVEEKLGTEKKHVLSIKDDTTDHLLPVQIIKGSAEDKQEEQLIFEANKIPSLGYKQFKLLTTEGYKDNEMPGVSDNILENKYFRIIVSPETGIIDSIYDKVNKKEVLGTKGGNFLEIYQDETKKESAWNICYGKFEQIDRPESITIKEKGPVKVSLELTYRYSQEGRTDSIFKLEIALYHNQPLIEFDLRVDWRAKFRTVKVGFNLNGYSDYTTYEIPFGCIKRKNPLARDAEPAEREKWEVAGQKWIDYTYSDGNYGVSLLNDSKYGFDQQDDVIRMTLLRSPVYPNPINMGLKSEKQTATDQGVHRIKYALYPHQGDWKQAKTPVKGYEFNYTLLPYLEESHTGELPGEYSYLRVNVNNVLISSLKKAEDSEEMLIRLYEVDGKDTSFNIQFNSDIKKACETDLMENELETLSVFTNKINCNIGANEIKTLKIKL